ncbi:MAG: hypothetical protein WEC17_03015 [Candidatus Saccharimonadales bacterium]
MKTSATELKDFVIHQAAEDAVLSPSERQYQEQLVNDVLRQEVQAPKKLAKLLDEYKANIKFARAKGSIVKV